MLPRYNGLTGMRPPSFIIRALTRLLAGGLAALVAVGVGGRLQEQQRFGADVSAARLEDREALLRLVDRQAPALERTAEAGAMGVYQGRAVKLLTSPAVKQAFDLGREAGTLRDR